MRLPPDDLYCPVLAYRHLVRHNARAPLMTGSWRVQREIIGPRYTAWRR